MEIKLSTGGGLGDAAMALAKLHAKYNPNDVILTHMEVHRKLLPAIKAFYNTQNIVSKVKYISSWKDKRVIGQWLDTGWKEGWEINPFPPLIYEEVDVDILVGPTAGRNSNRQLTQKELSQIAADNVTYVGNTGGHIVEKLKGKSLIGKTSMQDLVNLICSCRKIYTMEGFIAYFGAMAGKEVYVKRNNMPAIKKRKHPDWKMYV